VGDFLTFRHAVYEYYTDVGEYPRERAAGRVPPELEPYLEGRLSFDWRAEGYRYDWENWQRPGGGVKPAAANTGSLRSLSVRADVRDHPLLLAIARYYDGPLVVRRKYVSFIIEPYKAP
jgi:hypothetical protein